MPTWCHSRVTVQGQRRSVEAALATADASGDGHFICSSILPEPEGTEALMKDLQHRPVDPVTALLWSGPESWRVDRWGVLEDTSKANGEPATVTTAGPHHQASWSLRTSFMPPEPAVRALALAHPDLLVTLHSFEAARGVAVAATYHAGNSFSVETEGSYHADGALVASLGVRESEVALACTVLGAPLEPAQSIGPLARLDESAAAAARAAITAVEQTQGQRLGSCLLVIPEASAMPALEPVLAPALSYLGLHPGLRSWPHLTTGGGAYQSNVAHALALHASSPTARESWFSASQEWRWGRQALLAALREWSARPGISEEATLAGLVLALSVGAGEPPAECESGGQVLLSAGVAPHRLAELISAPQQLTRVDDLVTVAIASLTP